MLSAEGPFDAADEPVFADLGSIQGLPVANVAGLRADLQVLAMRQTAAEHVLRDSWRDWVPTVGLTVEELLSQPATAFSLPHTWEATALLTWPIYEGGLRFAQRNEREALVKEAQANLTGGKVQARSDVRIANDAIRLADQGLVSARNAARQAHEALDIVNLSYNAGASTSLDVLDAQRRARDADTSVAVAEDAARQARLDFLVGSGRFLRPAIEPLIAKRGAELPCGGRRQARQASAQPGIDALPERQGGPRGDDLHVGGRAAPAEIGARHLPELGGGGSWRSERRGETVHGAGPAEEVGAGRDDQRRAAHARQGGQVVERAVAALPVPGGRPLAVLAHVGARLVVRAEPQAGRREAAVDRRRGVPEAQHAALGLPERPRRLERAQPGARTEEDQDIDRQLGAEARGDRAGVRREAVPEPDQGKAGVPFLDRLDGSRDVRRHQLVEAPVHPARRGGPLSPWPRRSRL